MNDTNDAPPLYLNRSYIIRTVTHYQLGRVVSVTPRWVVLEDASWIADTGRWHDFLKGAEASEIEPFIDPVIVSTGAIVDATEYRHELPRKQK